MKLVILINVLALVALSHGAATSKRSHQEARNLALRVLESVPMIDGHNDLAMNIRGIADGILANADLSFDLTSDPLWENCRNCHTDIPRMRAGMMGGQFWSAYTGCSTQYKDAAQRVIDAIDIIKRFSAKHSSDFQFVTTAQGIWDAFNAGKIASMIGVEGGHAIDNRLAILRQFYDMGARYMSLNHVCNTPWCDTSNVDDPATGMLPISNGLSEFGKTVIREMNRLGMLVDLAHVSKAAQLQTIEISRAPVIYSHSSAFTLCNHHRNVHDDVLQLVRDTNAIVMVNFYNSYVTCSDVATIQDVADHINHIVNVAGHDHVGIGSDFDGITLAPTGLDDVSFYPDLFTLLAEDTAWTEENLRKLAGENLIRVFADVEAVRDAMAAEGVTPYEDNIPVADLGNNTACYSPQ